MEHIFLVSDGFQILKYSNVKNASPEHSNTSRYQANLQPEDSQKNIALEKQKGMSKCLVSYWGAKLCEVQTMHKQTFEVHNIVENNFI